MVTAHGRGLQQANFEGLVVGQWKQNRIKPKPDKLIVMSELVQKPADQTHGENLFIFQRLEVAWRPDFWKL